jgi:hypothetical protein
LAIALAACGPIGGDGSAGALGTGGSGSSIGTGGGGAGDSPAGVGGGIGGGTDTDAGGVAGDPDARFVDPNHRMAPGGYYVDGPNILTADGKLHRFHGLSRPSLEWSTAGEHLSQSDYALMKAWNANVVRVPLNQDFWLPGAHHADGYEHVVDQNVQWIEGLGMDVILDLHWSDRGDANGQPGQQRMADQNSIAFWKAVAAKYKGDGRVIFELYNEPHDVTWDVWRNGGPSGDGFTVAGMQQLYDAVRSAGADNLVVVGGLRFAFDLSQVGQTPVSGYNITYATHPYDQADKQPVSWNPSWGYLTAKAPVIVTEFGSFKTCSAQYYSDLITYADAHNASWIGWAWYPKDCAFPSLIADWAGTPTAAGSAIKAALSSY